MENIHNLIRNLDKNKKIPKRQLIFQSLFLEMKWMIHYFYHYLKIL